MEQNNRKAVVASRHISKYYLDAWGIDPDTVLETEVVSPRTLLTANRMDLVCKLYYIDCKEKGLDMAFAKELYDAHIKAFSNGVFIEPGLKTKNSIQDYYDSFDELIVDIRNHGFDPAKSMVPVGEDGEILDGSHRTAIAIYYNLPITVVHIPGQKRQYDYLFFRNKGMCELHLDFMAYQYIHYCNQVYVVCLWPAAYDEKKLIEVDRMIHEFAEVEYRKEISLNLYGVEQLMLSFYKGMEWIGNLENGFSGIASKAHDCYRKSALTVVYVIGGVPLEQVLRLKQRIRDYYEIGNSSVHITDTHLEAIEAGKLLLNQNSIDFMNYGNPFRNKSLMQDFINKVETRGGSCCSIETTLALYGIKEQQACIMDIVEDDLQSPKDVMFFWSVPLPSLDYVKSVKRRSGRSEDLNDLQLIEAFVRKRHRTHNGHLESTNRILRDRLDRVFHFFTSLWKKVKRITRVGYHRIRYRDWRTGTGEKDNDNLQAVFLNINTTTGDYLILRNWEGFFDDILMEGHNDIDILCRDKDTRDIIVRLLDAKPLTQDGFHFCFQNQGREVVLDTRVLGDGYYDRRWQRDMLRHKRLHPLGFFVMDPQNYYYSLIYHAMYQKKDGLSEEYASRLNQMSPTDGTLTQKEFAEQLDSFMHRNRYFYTVTMDQSVVNNFDSTSIPKRICYPLSIRLYHFMQAVKKESLLQRVKIRLRKLFLEGK